MHTMADLPTTHLLYLHGFRSSPGSAKARRMATLVQNTHPDVTWWCPQLPPSPREAMQMVADGMADWPRDRTAVVGSSLGGFYATWVMAETGCKAVLLNPAVDPARDLERYIGEQTTWHDPQQSFFFQPEFVDELKTLERPHTPAPAEADRLMAVIAKGDEVLNWREMTARYSRHAGARIRLIEGSDHALGDFDDHVGAIMAFLALA